MLRPVNVFQDGFLGDLFDDYFRDFRPYPVPKAPNRNDATFSPMKTDIKDLGNSYELIMDLPGYKKENINAELKDGYLVVTASYGDENETEENGYIRKERFTGSRKRAFFVGKKLEESDITAAFADGVLKLSVPKENTLEREEEKKLISID